MNPANTTIALGADHAGEAMKAAIREMLEAAGHPVLDLGTHGTESVDYPDFGAAVAGAVAEGRATFGVLVCGTGIGISIAANRNPAIRCALVHDVTGARLTRQHNDANVIALGARMTGVEVALDAVRIFLATPFDGGRHGRRILKISPGWSASPCTRPRPRSPPPASSPRPCRRRIPSSPPPSGMS